MYNAYNSVLRSEFNLRSERETFAVTRKPGSFCQAFLSGLCIQTRARKKKMRGKCEERKVSLEVANFHLIQAEREEGKEGGKVKEREKCLYTLIEYYFCKTLESNKKIREK